MSNHPDQATIIMRKQERNNAHLALRKRFTKSIQFNPQKNSTCNYGSVENEIQARNKIVADQIKCMKSQLPVLLKQLSKIKDPRNPKK